MLAEHGGDECQGTSKFVTLCDSFFDCMNTRHLEEGEHKIKPNLNPYNDANDVRLKVLALRFRQTWIRLLMM